ncbi:DUF5134 domain-containing protein [Streptomyces flavidovirens]|uniref:DUF5134 domain-containing protein n=1 Tax=Streptomyces flavidovirens TaxID=67298 RepID=UPI00341C58E4
MHGQTMSGWLLVALCAATGAYCLLGVRSGRKQDREGAAGEALMGFGMAAMAVPAAVLTPPVWGWMLYAAVFGGAAVRALWRARGSSVHPHHAHHLVGSLAMVYMALVMAQGGAGSGHAGHGAGYAAGGVPVLTGALLLYYAAYVLRSGVKLMPVAAGTAGAGGGTVAWGARPELALACRVSMGIGMIAMLLTV